ncbi:type VI secretion system tube protein TssD [Olleya sp. HaHaR_3_96]|uniref:type VI secretion system tube protein TssD n=1 Tax=Olleya sp. HaHaR_3_96 TaxID=2745560 RepID=UPI001C4ED824|nr:type VI secretion system tube protein TssD [Olleya sp. HaHaR_3_96]QXP58266.1 hypothetical protein H0I26_10055 [Olleya sp. HaHaR_3_96]
MIKAKILIDGKEINVLWFSFGFNQEAGHSGRPSQRPVFIGLKLIIETRKDLNLTGWSFSPNQTKQIELHIYPIIIGGRTRKLYFYDCHLVNWKNAFSSTGSNPISETLEITCAGVEDSTSAGVYSAYWRETFPQKEVEPITRQETKDLIFVSAHFENENNKKINEKYNGKANLVIKTQNGIGKIIDINLSNTKHNFKYNGKNIDNDLLKDVSITSDTLKLELEIIEEQNT